MFTEAATTPTCLGIGEWVRSNLGTAAERSGWHERLRPCERQRRACSRLLLARLLVTLEHCKTALAELVDAIRPFDQCVENDHAYLLAE